MPPSPLGPRDHRGAGPFVFEARLGRGGFGVVYLGVSGATQAAVKILDTDRFDAVEVRRRLASELSKAQLVAPFVTARVLDFNLDDDPPYIATEYIDGPTLAEAVEGKPLGDADLHRVAAQTLLALEAIHEAGVIHRDFKPGNIMLGSGGIRVIDFGIARGWDSTAHTNGQLGTLPYMAPEQFRGEAITSAVDLFAWGSTMVYVGTGHLPWGEYEPEIINRILHAEPALHGLEGRMRDVVLACLEKDPAARPSAAEAGRILLRGTSSAARSRPVATKREPFFRRRKGGKKAAATPPARAASPGPPSFSAGRAALPAAGAAAALPGAGGLPGGRIPGMSGSLPSGGSIPGGGRIPGAGGGIPGGGSIPGGSIPGGGRIPGAGGGIPGGGSIPGVGSIPGGGRIPGAGGTVPGMGGTIPGMGGSMPGGAGKWLPPGMRTPAPPLRAPMPPVRRGPWVVVVLLLVALLGAGGAYWFRDHLPSFGGLTARQSPSAAAVADEFTAFSAAWPADSCKPEAKPPAGQVKRTNCRADGIAVYLIQYDSQATRDNRRKSAVNNGLGPQRLGASPSGGRGPYVEFRVNAKTVGLWWDDGASRPDGRTALLLHMPYDRAAKDPAKKLRDAYLGQGFELS